MFLLDGVEQLQSIELAALQPDVEKNKIWPACHDCRQRIVAIARCARAIALVLKDTGDQIADIGLIIDIKISAAIIHSRNFLFFGLAVFPQQQMHAHQAPRWPEIFSGIAQSSSPCSSTMRPQWRAKARALSVVT
jgi:hypothetical protein